MDMKHVHRLAALLLGACLALCLAAPVGAVSASARLETIQALGSPTVNEFASFMKISPPNAAYKINSLIRKGYIQKIQSEHDKREYHLQVTQKYKDYYNISNDYVHMVTERIRERFSPEECAKLEEMLAIVDQELMPEVDLGQAETT